MTPATAQPKKARRSSRPWWLVRFACLCSLLKKKKNHLIVLLSFGGGGGVMNFIG